MSTFLSQIFNTGQREHHSWTLRQLHSTCDGAVDDSEDSAVEDRGHECDGPTFLLSQAPVSPSLLFNPRTILLSLHVDAAEIWESWIWPPRHKCPGPSWKPAGSSVVVRTPLFTE